MPRVLIPAIAALLTLGCVRRIAEPDVSAPAPASGRWTVTGTVVAPGGDPVAGAKVYVVARDRMTMSRPRGLWRWRGLQEYAPPASTPPFDHAAHGATGPVDTGADGSFVLEGSPQLVTGTDPPELARVIIAHHPEFASHSLTAWKRDGRRVEVEILLKPGVALYGIVMDVDGKPLAGAYVGLQRTGLDPAHDARPRITHKGVRVVRADGDGRYRIDALAPGWMAVAAWTDATGPVQHMVRIEGADVLRDFYLAAAAPEEAAKPVAPPHARRAQSPAEINRDYRRLCSVCRKTVVHEGQPPIEITPAERELLLAELGRREGAWFAHDFRRMAAKALGNLRAADAVPRLVALLNDATEEPGVSAEAALALGKIGDPPVLGHLLRALGDDRTWVRRRAAAGIRALSPDAATVKRHGRDVGAGYLLDVLKRLAMPATEDEWFNSYSTATNKAWWKALNVDAVCAGLNLLGPDLMNEGDRLRARELAKAVVNSGFPPMAYENPRLAEMTRFCRTYQPQLLKKKVGGLRRRR